jgi:hypothetical protein
MSMHSASARGSGRSRALERTEPAGLLQFEAIASAHHGSGQRWVGSWKVTPTEVAQKL